MKRRGSWRTRSMPADAEDNDHTHQVLMYDTPTESTTKGLPTINSSEGLDANNNSFMTFRHKASITALAVIKTTQQLCAGTQDNLIVVWELNEFTPAYSLQGHNRSIMCLENVPDTQILISASVDQTMRVWDGDNQFQCVQILTGYNGHILSMTSTNDTLFMACQDTKVKVAAIHAKSPHTVLSPTTEWRTFSNHHGFVYGIHYVTPDVPGKKPMLFTCSSDNSIVSWDTQDMTVLASLHSHRGSVLDLVSVGNQLFSASQDKTICCWDLDTMRCNGILKGHTAAVLTLCSLEDKNRICSGSADETVRIWNTQSLACVHTLHGHRGGVSSILSTEMFVFSASEDSTVKVWDIDFISNMRLSQASPDAVPTKPQQFKMDSSLMSVSAMHNKHTSDASMIHLLRKFVSIQSVSVDPLLVDDCWMAAKFVKGLLRQLGAECRLVHCGPNINPIVIGKLGNDPSKPTVLITGHYDVQPANIKDGWDSNPFMLTGQNGYLYGRGTTDDKGPIIATLFAIRELLAAQGARSSENCDESSKRLKPTVEIPNFVFLYQGEGENQSQGIRETVEDNLAYFGPIDLVFISNNYWLGDSTPCLTYGMRGCLEIQVKVDGPGVDLHAGVDGGAIRAPVLDVVALINRIIDPITGKYIETTFYDSVRPVSEEEAALFRSLEFDVDAYKKTLGVTDLLPAFQEKSKLPYVDVLMNRWRFPSVSVSSVKGSIDNSSIIAKSASTDITLRTVPDQSPEEIEKLVLTHIQREFNALNTTNKLTLTVKANVPWWLGDLNSRYFKAAEQALEKHWKIKPMLVREGGMSQNTTFLKTILKAPCMHFPMGQASDRAHLQNERIRLRNLRTGKDVLVDFFATIAQDDCKVEIGLMATRGVLGVLLIANAFVGVLFWSFVEALPREIYWFSLQMMDIPYQLQFLGILVLPPLLLMSYYIRYLCAKYCSVGYFIAVVCLLVRFGDDDAQDHLVMTCVGTAVLFLVLFSLWSFMNHTQPLSADHSITLPELSITGIVLGNLLMLWMRWANASLNPLLAGNAVVDTVGGLCVLPSISGCFVLFYYRNLFQLEHPSMEVNSMTLQFLMKRFMAMIGFPCLFFLTHWIYTAPTAISRWIGVSPLWGWLILTSFTLGSAFAQTGGCLVSSSVLLVGGICFHASTNAGLSLFGAVLIGFSLPSVWLSLVPATFLTISATSVRELISKPTIIDSGLPSIAPVVPEPSRTKTCSMATCVCCSTLTFIILYALLLAFTIALTTYDYLPEELAFLRGQRFPIFYIVLCICVISNVALARTIKFVHFGWSTMDKLRLWVVILFIGIVIVPASVSHEAIYLAPGEYTPTKIVKNITSDFRILSFNVYQGFNRAGGDNFFYILKMINDYDPHIITLQESDTMQTGSGSIDITEFLALHRGMYSFSNPKTQEDSFGCTLLSSFPIEPIQGIVLPALGENACLQHVMLTIYNKPVNLINIHLGNDGTNDRNNQLDLVMQQVNNATGPLILTGDFNTPKLSSEYLSILTRTSLVDAGSRKSCRIPSPFPSSRNPIEYVFFRNLTCIQFESPTTYDQQTTADSFPRIVHLTL
ncbi:wd repeat-containing protein [Thraustotheca clavata]|uniref:Wd repeat-containing protein n=1 Tax=Thraustotheca clavata TaxID=74557 RepID=A0A1W0AAN6_9STRA|nr:wd repeat-containing protein [Thraustotheca clavata]